MACLTGSNSIELWTENNTFYKINVIFTFIILILYFILYNTKAERHLYDEISKTNPGSYSSRLYRIRVRRAEIENPAYSTGFWTRKK